MAGYDCPYVPGWDCHGLPIEHQVDKELKAKGMKLVPGGGAPALPGLCPRSSSTSSATSSSAWGCWGTGTHPYLTMNHAYVAAILEEYGQFFFSGAIYRSKKPVHWCATCRTALAEAEVEYEEHRTPSILRQISPGQARRRRRRSWDGLSNVSLVIWTTTPWTLPANLAIAVHPDLDYAAVDVGRGSPGGGRGPGPGSAGPVGPEGARSSARSRAAQLEGAICRHPWLERDSLVILADYVTLEAGTGLVHIAPGHGQEDYDSGRKYGLAPYSPVDDDGRFTEEVPEFAGQKVFEANAGIIELLRQQGQLLAAAETTHSYPHCWRCKQPIIFRATEQWFISMEHNGLRQKALEAIDRVTWIPRWGRERIYQMVERRPDWCISRQRAWGVPIVAFHCQGCGEVLLTPENSGRASSSGCAGRAPMSGLPRPRPSCCPPGTRCPHCGAADFHKETDILDVWFDSGVSFAAVLEPDPEPGAARGPLPGRLGPAPGLVSQQPADRGGHPGPGPLQGGADPRLRGGRRGPQDVQVPGQRHRPPGGHGHLRGGDPAAVGGRRGLPGRRRASPTIS